MPGDSIAGFTEGKDAMRLITRFSRRWFHCFVGILMLAIGFPSGCSHDAIKPTDFSGKVPILRILLLQGQTSVALTASQPPSLKLTGDPKSRQADLPAGVPVQLTLSSGGWQLGAMSLGTGELILLPASEGSVAVGSHAYRGRYRFVPKGGGQFDVVIDVDVEGYLSGVLPCEMPPTFADEAYKAQCVVARTYAIYEHRWHAQEPEFDLYNDERSMVYGGLSSETPKSIAAVNATHGEVVAYGTPGSEHIFKAYFSSCCGGVGQSAAEAFPGDPDIPPLAAQANGSLCSISPRFTWPTVTVSKADLTHRFQHFGQIHNRQEKDIAAITRIDVMSVNAVGRPVMFTVTDAKNRRYAMIGEDLRRAVNTDATPKTRLLSSLFQVDNEAHEIRFVNGHGFGHGVGMCQWCAQARAEQGMGYRDIVLLSFPKAIVVRAEYAAMYDSK